MVMVIIRELGRGKSTKYTNATSQRPRGMKTLESVS